MKRFFSCVLLLILLELFILGQVSAQDNATCAVMKCKRRNTTWPGADPIKKCRCDSDCATYGDCCIDSIYRSTTSTTSNFDCVEIKYGKIPGAYLKRACSRPFRQYRNRARCSSSKNYDEQSSNFALKLPVIGSNGITYGNQFCAACEKITNFTYWDIHFSCEEHETRFKMGNATTFNSSTYRFNDTLQKWTYNSNNETETCVFTPIPPAKLPYPLRQCRPNLVKSCPSLSSYSKQCSNYTSIVRHQNGTYYKNEYCALCNNVSSTNLTCRRKNISSSYTTTKPTPTSKRPVSSSSPQTGITVTPPRFFPASSVTNNTTNITTEVREFLHIIVKQNCNDLLDSLTMTKLTVETKSFSTMKRTRLREANMLSGYPVRICKGDDKNEAVQEENSEESELLRIFVNLLVFVSILFILSHLYDFLFSSSGSTLSQKIFASYAIALTIGNIGFFLSNATENFCSLLGPIAYFGFLTSFFWLSALAFDISCKIWCCVQEFDILGKNVTNSEKFTTYSLISWIFPPVIIFIMIYVAERNGDFILEGRIYETCWFQNDETLLIFFAFPLTITMSVNLAFYLFSAYVVWLQRTAVVKLFAKHGIDFKFHTGLIITSNLMWSTALIAMYYDDSFLWVCFACLDATLGLLVYLCSPVKHAFSIKISAYLNQRFLPVGENLIQK
ncbi:uncharacterized protein LOC135842148 [Planococcus citri]|uniref:uncharacterized protein LOC135842148 n=1 Tax=Planococcus citri TaxID=170843 RepID=UPI0031FA44EB